MIKILITGPNGFIGKNLVDEFRSCSTFEIGIILRPHNHLSLDPKIKVIKGDLNNINSLKDQILTFDPDICIHLSWEGIPDFNSYYSQLNLNNSIDLIRFLSLNTNMKKLIISGSCFEYGKTQGMCSETDETTNLTYFSWAKNSLYEYSKFVCQKNRIDLIWTRIFFVYGPGQRSDALIPTIIRSMNKKQSTTIKKPNNKLDFIYVSDVVNMYKIACTKKIKSGIYNLGSGQTESIINIYNLILNKLNPSGNLDLALNNITSISENYYANMDKTRENFNWMPNFTMNDGIEALTQNAILN
tara:strand:+ start:1280 stop:2179 length:900 start_codon:yes stop_codon:yes gene_type:complete